MIINNTTNLLYIYFTTKGDANMPLSMVSSNQEVIISDVIASAELKQKLMNMGFTKGCKLYVLQGLTKGSIMVKVRDSKVVLNASTAHKIQCS